MSSSRRDRSLHGQRYSIRREVAGRRPWAALPGRPVPGLDLFVCGEAFSRAQSWVEGALETAEMAVEAALA